MYQYTFSEEDKKKIEQANKTKNLKDSFAEIDKKYSSSLTGNLEDSLNLEKMNFTRPSDEDIETQAQNSLEQMRNQQLKSIEDEYKTKSQNLDERIQSSQINAKNQKDELEQKYASLKQNASNDALKRGLARSSIVVNTLEAFDNSMLDNFVKINKDLTENINSLENQKDLLEEQKQSALNSFDIAYAVQLNEKINSINKDLQEQEEKVIKYNNEIAEKEAEYKRKKQQEALDYAEYIGKYGVASLESMKSSEKYNLALEYFKNLPKQQAVAELENDPSYKSELGTYYNKLLVKLKS